MNLWWRSWHKMSHYSCRIYLRAGIKLHYHSNQTVSSVFVLFTNKWFHSLAWQEAISVMAELPWTVWQEFCRKHDDNRHKWGSMYSYWSCPLEVGTRNEFNTWSGFSSPHHSSLHRCHASTPSSATGRVNKREAAVPASPPDWCSVRGLGRSDFAFT